MTLVDLKPGSEHEISSVVGDPVVVARLMELGFIRGEKVQLFGRAPFGEPLLIEIRGATIALRKSEASCVRL